jgi:hypothetical protein
MVNPADLNADLILPCDSLIDESQSPITENVGIPGDMETSIRETVESEPVVKHEYICTTLGFEGMGVSSFYSQNTLFEY